MPPFRLRTTFGVIVFISATILGLLVAVHKIAPGRQGTTVSKSTPQRLTAGSSSTRQTAPAHITTSSSSAPSNSTNYPANDAWRASDFDFSFATSVRGEFPDALPIYRSSFPGSPTSTLTSVGELGAGALAQALGFKGSVYRNNGYENGGRPFWITSSNLSPLEGPVPSTTTRDNALLVIYPDTGEFYYNSGKPCRSAQGFTSKNAVSLARSFIEARGLLSAQTTSTVDKPDSYSHLGPGAFQLQANCWEVRFYNDLPVDTRGNERSLESADSPMGLNLDNYDNTDVYSALWAFVSPMDRTVVAINSYGLKLDSQGVYQTLGVNGIKEALARDEADIIDSDFNRSLISAPLTGRLRARITMVYPLYKFEAPNPTSTIWTQIGRAVVPWYYSLAEVNLASVTRIPGDTGNILLGLPAIAQPLKPATTTSRAPY